MELIFRKYVLIAFSYLMSAIVHGQTALPIDLAKQQGIRISGLDSLYMSGVHSDSTLAVFHNNQNEFIAAYQKMLQELGKFLAVYNYSWDKPTKAFNRVYFDKDGNVDYFLYSFRSGQLTVEQETRFGDLLNQFIQTYKFPLTADRGFAQCSPVTFMPSVD